MKDIKPEKEIVFEVIKKGTLLPDDFIDDDVLNRNLYIIESGISNEGYWRNEYESDGLTAEIIGAIVIGSKAYRDVRYKLRTSNDPPYDLQKSFMADLIKKTVFNH